MFKNLKEFSLPEIEEKVLQFWKTHGIFQKSVEARKGNGKKFVFFEGPPTANGRPGLHHIEARSFKDIIPRYKTMRGYYVPRRAGWDTHGLPVELEVEKELGFKQKSEIEKFGIAEFNARCKDLVWKYRTEFENSTERMGFWLDMKNPYITYDNSYIESLWWLFAEINKKGYLKKLLKTVPWCFRCQTPLSSHELGQPGAYKLTKDPAVYVKFKVKGQSSKVKSPEYLLAWTTTPWTLPGNLALAVNPKLTYTKFEVKETESGKTEFVWAFNMPPVREGFTVTVVEKMSGKKLVGTKYEPLYALKVKSPKLKLSELYSVRAGDFVTTEDGSGIVHIAPSFGEEDFKLMGIKEGLPVTIDDKARMIKGYPGAGKYIKEADKDIVADLTKRGLLYQAGTLEHEYPYCWRCSNPLIYMVRESWFIEMSKLRDKMIKNNAQINWIPGHIKDGRFGEWLKDLKDWAISRNRYWGTPLPIWECQKCAKHMVISGLPELRERTKSTNRYFLVRHGEAQHNLDYVIASGPEKGKGISHLTEKGEGQILDFAADMKKEKVQLIFSSPYLRTKQTAEAIAKATKAKVIVDKRLGEINCGTFNWQSETSYHGYFANKLDRFFKAPPGGETLTDVRVRMINFIKDIDAKYQGKRIAIVSHGDPLWLLDSALKGLSNEETLVAKYYPTHEAHHEAIVSKLPYNKKGELDMHRPFVDDIAISCDSCKKGKAFRVKDVADVWFDSGGMPFAAPHFPFAVSGKDAGNVPKEKLATLYKGMDFPADYISEAVDQTRGWFYTLLAISTLLDRGIPYKNVICLGLLHDKHGVKMSKSKGNIVSPWDMMNKYGADAVRWYFYTINDPGDPKNFNEDDLGKTARRFILIIYNSFVFWNTYGHTTGKPSAHDEMTAPKHILDRWILSRLNALVDEVTKKLDAYAIGEAGRLIEEFSDGLSRWYIRRSRDRFQGQAKGDAGSMQDWEDATRTLRTVLLTLSKVVAPFMPFFAEALYKSIDGKMESVHLDNWPTVNAALIENELISDVEELRRVIAVALSLRADFKLKVRQPLGSLTLKSTKLHDKEEMLELLKDEINVKAIKFDEKLTDEKGMKLDTVITPQLREEGIVREVMRTIQGLRASAKYQMSDEIVLMFQAPDMLSDLIQRNAIQIKRAVTARTIEPKKSDKFDAELIGKVEDWEIWIAVRKV